jgi:hypothetical protein
LALAAPNPVVMLYGRYCLLGPEYLECRQMGRHRKDSNPEAKNMCKRKVELAMPSHVAFLVNSELPTKSIHP